MTAQIYKVAGTSKNRWRWRLVKYDGTEVAVSGGDFSSDGVAERAFRKVWSEMCERSVKVEIVEPKKKRS